MYHICLVVRFILPDMRYIAFLYFLGICCERTDTLKAKTTYLSIIAHCFIYCFFIVSISRTLLPICVFLSQSLFLLESILHPSTTLILSLYHNYTAAMARNRKPPSGRTTVTSDGSPGWEAAGDEETGNEEDTVHVTDQFSASFPLA